MGLPEGLQWVSRGLVITVCFRNEMDCCCISRSWLVHRPSFYISCKGCRYNVDRMEIWEIQFPLVSIRNWQSACLDSPIEWISPWKKLSSPVSYSLLWIDMQFLFLFTNTRNRCGFHSLGTSQSLRGSGGCGGISKLTSQNWGLGR